MRTDVAESDRLNSEFWNELCGTHLAKHLGIEDSSTRSLEIFDSWYMRFYSYLFNYLAMDDIRNKKVIEIGLGYGTLSQILFSGQCDYTGIDIASGPVEMVRLRIGYKNCGQSARAVKGTALNLPFQNESVDFIFAIGSLHHTGNLKQAISECHRVLKKNGKLVFMVYYAYSYRRIFTEVNLTIRYSFKEFLGYRGVLMSKFSRERLAYDANKDGHAAPHTDWISKKSLKVLCSQFSEVSCYLENIDNGKPYNKEGLERRNLLKTIYPKIWGLDLYCEAKK